MFGEHASFIISSYAITFVALTAMVVVTVMNYRKRKAELAKLESDLNDGET